MAITSSAKKALRVSLRKRVFNIHRKKALTGAMKEVRKALAAGKTAEAEKLLANAYKAIDKAAKRNVISKNTAARKKSRLARAIRRLAVKK